MRKLEPLLVSEAEIPAPGEPIHPIYLPFSEQQLRTEALARDLPHRGADWPQVARRVGWLTFEDCEELFPGT